MDPVQDTTNTQTSTPSTDAAISGVSVKIPPFWPRNPQLWFVQVESQFITRGITSDTTKYYHVLASIESTVLEQISDFVLNPPSTDKYLSLKALLIKEYTDSQEKQVKILLNELQLGDKKPSQLLREMRKLSNGQVDDKFLKTMFLEHLPAHARSILSVSVDNLNTLAEMADKIMDHTPRTTIAVADTVSPMAEALEKLQIQINELAAQIRNKPRSRSRSKSRSRSNYEMCWYHHKFGARAKKCIQPCNFASSSGN